MLNLVWSFLLLCGLAAAALLGNLGPMMDSVFVTCEAVVMKIALPLAGKMMLWLGVLRVMERAGLMEVIARVMSPLLRLLFPEVPAQHPAMGAITMNISANLLGLGNSATPMGLKAMEHLQELNPSKRTASNAMCMFLAINTAGLTLIPFQAITFLSNGGMKNPYAIILPTLAATFCAAVAAVLAAKLLQRLPMYQVKAEEEEAGEGDSKGKVAQPFRLTGLRIAMIAMAALSFAVGACFEFAPSWREGFLQKTGLKSVMDGEVARKKEVEQHAAELKKQKDAAAVPVDDRPAWRRMVESGSALAIPVVLLAAVLVGLAKGVPVYEAAVEGAKEGFDIAVRIMPFLVIMLTGITVFRESGALMLLEHVLRPVLDWIHFPVELLPMAIMRPLSGSGSSGLLNELILRPGAGDFLKYTAAVMYGSTETTFYVLAVYFGSVGISRIRHALAVGIIADIVGMTCAVTLGWMLFGGR
jgi:spore maturation protein SpmA